MKALSLSKTFLKTAATTLAAGVMSSALAAPPETAQEKFVIEYMASRGVTKFVMLNEKRGVIMAVQDGDVSLTVPALSGKNKGDDLAVNPASTPAGIFPLLLSPDQTAGSATMRFKRWSDVSYVIHHVPPSSKGRQARLEGRAPFTHPEDRRISNGCINLKPQDYGRLAEFAAASHQTLYDRQGRPLESAKYLVVLPETANMSETRQFFGVPSMLTVVN